MASPIDLAAFGSFAEPKSTTSTTSTIRMCHGLSKSPISLLSFSRRTLPTLRQRYPSGTWYAQTGAGSPLRGRVGVCSVRGEGRGGVRPDGRREHGRRHDAPVFTQAQGQPAGPCHVRGAQGHPEPPVAQFGHVLARVVLGHPAPPRGQLEYDAHVVGRGPEQALVHVHRLR